MSKPFDRRKQYQCMNRKKMRNSTERTRRERLLVREALRKFGFRYWEVVEINNPLLTNRAGDIVGGQQWIDFIVLGYERKLFAIEFYPKWGRHNPHRYQLDWLEEKKQYLSSRNIRTIVLPRNGMSSQDYYGKLYILLHSRQHIRGG